MNVEAGFQLPDLKGIARRRIKAALGVALLVSLAAYWLAMALPNEYGSYATVLVEPQSVDPDLVEAGVPQADLNRRLHLMAAQILSRPRLSRIIDELDLYESESKYLVRDEVINLMRMKIRVEPVIPEMEQGQGPARGVSQIDQFRIHFQDDDPVVARDVAQRLANDFIEEHIASRVRVSQKSLEFIEAELSRLADAISEVEAKVAAVKAANPGRLPEDMASNKNRADRLVSELAVLRSEVATARSDEAFFRSQSATARELMGVGGNEADTPAARLRMLELAMSDYEARGLTEKHPDMIKARAEIELLRTQVAADSTDERPGSFAEHSATAEAERARLRRIHAEEEIAGLAKQAEAVQALLAETPQVAEQLDALARDYRHMFQSYQDFSTRRLEAGVQADLERRQLGEQFRVLEPAFLAPQPSSPDRMVIVAMGVFFGLALGGGIGIVLEAADGSVHTARQLQTSLDLPVLASIPNIWLEQDRLKQRRGRIRTAAATLAIVVFALVGGAVNYWWVNGSVGEREPEEAPPAATTAAEETAAVGGP